MLPDKSKGLCFVIAPIGNPGTPERLHSDEVFDRIIRPAIEECDYEPKRADHITKPGMITRDMIESIYKAPLVIANLTGNNANVYYELALRHTLEKPVIILIPYYQDPPFDIVGNRAIEFNLEDASNVEKCKQLIIEHVRVIENSPDDYYNPISLSLDVITALDDANFTPRDVRKALDAIPDLEKKFNIRQFAQVYFVLRSKGVLTKRELRELMSDDILSILRRTYIEELLRSEDHPLDPMAIAYWGADLYIGSHTDLTELEALLRQTLRLTPEYMQNHGELVIHSAKYGLNDIWEDKTLIVQRAVRNAELYFLVSNSTLGSDPVRGDRKELRVFYSYKGIPHEETVVLEGQSLRLP